MGTTILARRYILRYGIAPLIVTLAALVQWALMGTTAPFLLLLSAIVAVAWYGGLGPGLLATALGAVVAVFFFLEPLFSFQVDNPTGVVALALFGFLGTVISLLSEWLQRSERSQRQARERALLETVDSLRESRERLRSIVESSDDAIIGKTPEGTIVSWNRGAERIYGYTAGEAVGQPILMLVSPGLADESRQILERIKQGEHVKHFKAPRVRKDGREIVVSQTVSPILNETGQVIGASEIDRDITEQERLEGELRLQAKIAANLAEAVNLVRERDAVIVYYNERFEQMFGYGPGELRGKPVSVLNAPGEKGPEETAKDIIRVLRKTGVWRGEVQNVRRDGTLFWTYASVSTFEHPEHGTVWVGVQSDITERKQMEGSLRESRARLRAVVETATDAIITIDEHGIIDSVNPATERMFGYPAAEMIGQNVKMLMPFPYSQEHDGYLARYLRTRKKRIIGIGREVQGRRKDGSIFPVGLAVSEFHDRTQHMFSGIVRDLSARKALEREVLEAAKMEQWRIGQELHDCTGQELTALGLLAEGLVEALTKSSPSEAVLATKIAEGLRGMLGQVRALSRGLIPVEVDAEGLMAALGELASRTSELHGVTCTFECREPVLVEDNQTATHLYRIATEAVTNALKYSRAKNITIALESDVKSATLRIWDDGVGFPREPVEIKGMGLKIMRYRAGLIDAQLAVGPAEPVGTLVSCIFNKGADHAQEQDK